MEFTDKIEVRLYQQVGSDRAICDTARVSTLGEEADQMVREANSDTGLINYLMKNKHGSPFEHGLITFIVTAPIFVFWDHVRHRIGVSYNIESSRYRELKPRFFVPDEARTQSGKPGAYVMTPASQGVTDAVRHVQRDVCYEAWEGYKTQLDLGVAREQAMQILPMNTVISAYVTFNPRSLMNFLELRLGPARKEMQQLAGLYRDEFRKFWPVTDTSFEVYDRVAP